MTLIELVVAMAIFAMLAVMAQRAIVHASGQARGITERRDGFEQVQLAMARLARDMETIVARPVRSADGDSRPPVMVSRDGAELELTRGSVENPAEQIRSAYQRVRFFTDAEGVATRALWTRTEPAAGQPPDLQALPDRIDALRFRAYHADTGWVARWPPKGGPDSLPDGLEVTFTAAPWGELHRVVSLR